jgi:EmrB/QacA subfamily drug resistance transporter
MTTNTLDQAPNHTPNQAPASASAPVPVPAPTSRSRWLALGVLCLALLIIVVDTTIVNVAIPTLARQLHPSSGGLVWIVDAYTLAFAAMLLPAGTLGDRYGRRHSLLAGLAVFGAGSAAAALTHTADQLIAMRVVMGIGAAFIMPATLSLLAAVFTNPAERAKAIGIWSAISGVGVALGPTIGGWLLEHYSWASIFWVNVPVVITAIVGAVLLVPASKSAIPARIDIPGALLAALAFGVLTYALIEAPAAGWASTVTAVRFGVSAVLLAAFVGWELRSSHPMMDLSLFRNRAFTAANVTVSVLFFALSGVTFAWTQILQFVLGYGTFAAGLRSLPSAAMLIVVSLAGPRLASRFGTRTVVAAGLAIMAGGLAYFSTVNPGSGYPQFVVGMVIMCAGIGLAMAPTTQTVMLVLPPARTGIGSAVTTTTRNLGSVLGVAITGSIIASIYTSTMRTSHTPAAVAQSIGAAATIGRQFHDVGILHTASAAFIHGADAGVWISIAIAIVAIPVAFGWLPRRQVH